MTARRLWAPLALAIALGVACSASGNGNGDDKGGAGGGAATANGGSGAAVTGGSGGGGATTGGASGASATGGGAGDASTSGEICNDGQDNDGNGLVDEGCSCSANTTQACWTGPAERRHVGQCKDGLQACLQTGEFLSWGPCAGEVLPATEVPGNGVDEDCDGQDPGGPCVPSGPEDCWSGKDDDCNGLQDCQDPACASACNCKPTEDCTNGVDDDCDFKVDCDDADCVNATACKPVTGCTPQFPFFYELVCNDKIDNDCDGKIDCDDPDCKRPGECGCAQTETNCSDGKDEDCDKSTDCADRDCQKCTPGSTRYCDDPQYCHWGKQICGSDDKWGACVETTDLPAGCTGTMYSTQCCVQAGKCCQNYPTDDQSVGNCSNIVTCK